MRLPEEFLYPPLVWELNERGEKKGAKKGKREEKRGQKTGKRGQKSEKGKGEEKRRLKIPPSAFFLVWGKK